ncbi:MAG: hypothetical protein AMJ81_03640 [Phycisphaerae bacterium SM23_33]|nr:MAG: hypothetical protein AMJ81_03640 [Phycisphaerae bacterium SM23_33]
MKTLNTVALVLVVVGALNWGLVGIADFDLVAAIFGHMSVLSRIVYILVALAGLYSLSLLTMIFKRPAEQAARTTG